MRAIPRPVALGLLCAVILLTRLPFLGAGYGLHADNWRTALAARHIATTGVYEASRLPGYPVQEYVCSLFWKTGPFGFNLLDALFCAAAALAFALICIDYGVADWWLAALALAFVPVLYVNSVSSKDFPWGLAFLLASWWCAMRKRPVLTGILLGLAMGCRITSGAAALPIALILIDGTDNRIAIRRVLLAGSIATAITVAAFIPVFHRYGTGFFSFYSEHAMPGPLEIAARMTLEVWGLFGLAGLCLALAAAPFAVQTAKIVQSREDSFEPTAEGGKNPQSAIADQPFRQAQGPEPVEGHSAIPQSPSRQLLAWTSMLVIYVIAFFCLPDQAEYLLPAVPFILLLVWRAAPQWAFRACCALIIVSPFISWSGLRPTSGMLIHDHRDRIVTDTNINHFLQFAGLVSGSNAYIVGSWQPPISVLTAGAPPPDTQFLYLVTQPELDKLTAQGWHVWYLPGMREFNYRVYQFDVAQHGARDVRLLHPDRKPGEP